MMHPSLFSRHVSPQDQVNARAKIAALASRSARAGDGGGADVTVGDSVSELMYRLGQCMPPQVTPGLPGSQYPMSGQVPAPVPGGTYAMGGCGIVQAPCGKSAFQPVFASGLALAVAGGAASGVVPCTPKVPFKAFRLVVPGGANWRVTSIQIGMREYIASAAGVSAFVFADQEAESGKLDLDWASPAQPINTNATNITGGALDWNPTFHGAISSS